MGLQTEFDFVLPKGYVSDDGTLHRRGVMRLATARDEIEPLRDQRVSGPDDPYLTILVISRVVKELGSLPSVSPRDIEGLFAADLAFLQDLYGIINFGNPADAEVLQRAVLTSDDESDEVDDVADAEDAVPVEAEPVPIAAADPDSMTSAPRRRGRIEEISPHAVS
jgi:hypothetical protein